MESRRRALEGRVAVVTGAGRGIGRVASIELARRGAKLVLASRTEGELCEVAHHITSKGGHAVWWPTDVRDSREVKCLFEKAHSRYGQIHILVNNAGGNLADRGQPIEEVEIDDWEATFALNLRSVINCCREAIPYLKKAKGGRIINIASAAGLCANADHIAYSSSKAAVINLTVGLAAQLLPYGISVNAICPGSSGRPKQFRRWRIEPVEIIGVIAFLASDEAACLTGNILITPPVKTGTMEERFNRIGGYPPAESNSASNSRRD